MKSEDRADVLEFADRIWEGHDYLGYTFGNWVGDPEAYFAAMVLGDRVVGCGRLLPLDRRRGWLEGLRVNPDLHGRGLGRLMAHHVMSEARGRGFEELLFSTYFDNVHSIRISEKVGFVRTHSFTNLEFKLATAPADLPDDIAVQTAPGLPVVDDLIWNDWLFLPSDLPDRGKHLPEASTVRHGSCCIVLTRNTKYPHMLDIGWMDSVEGESGRLCLYHAMNEARRLGCTGLHTMVPEAASLDLYRELGFFYFERPLDVHLYRAETAQLKA